jgi:hypothetical protein
MTKRKHILEFVGRGCDDGLADRILYSWYKLYMDNVFYKEGEWERWFEYLKGELKKFDAVPVMRIVDFAEDGIDGIQFNSEEGYVMFMLKWGIYD